MTLPLNSRLSALYDTNGTQKDFSFGFRVFFDPDNGGYGLEVRRQTADGYEVIPKSDYLVLPVEDNSAGVVRFSVAPSAGQQIYIAGKTPTIQQLVLTNFGRYSAESIETQFDFITAIIQEWLSALSEETRQRIAADDILTQYVVQRIDDFVQQVNQNWDDKSQEIEDYIATIMPSFTQTLRDEIEAFAVAGMQDAIDQTLAESKAEIDDAVARANAAATAAAITGKLYDTPEAGVNPVTGVADGAYFNVRSPSNDSYVDEYQNVGGVPTPTGKTYPSGAALTEVEEAIIAINNSTTKDSSLSIVSGFANNNADEVLSFLQFNKMLAKFQPGAEISIEKPISVDLTGTKSTEIDLQGATLNFKTGGRLTFRGKTTPYLTTTATTDLRRGGTYFQVASVAGIAKGDLIVVKSPVVITGATKLTQTYIVQGIDVANRYIYVMACIVGDIRADQITAQGLTGSITVECYKVAERIKVTNGKLTSLNRDDEGTAVYFDGFYHVDCTGLTPDKTSRTSISAAFFGFWDIDKCLVIDPGYVENDQGYNSIPSNPSGLGFGYGFLANNGFCARFFNNHVVAGWHGFDAAGGVTFAIAMGNTLHKGAFGLSSHEGQWSFIIQGNTVLGGHAVTCRSFELTFKDNIGRGIKNRFIIGSRRMQSLIIDNNDIELSSAFTGNFLYFDGAYPESCFSLDEPIAKVSRNTVRNLAGVSSRLLVWKNLDLEHNDFGFGDVGSISFGALVSTGRLNIKKNTLTGVVSQAAYSIIEPFAEVNIIDEDDYTTTTLGGSSLIQFNVPLPKVNLIDIKCRNKNSTVRNINNSAINFENVIGNTDFNNVIIDNASNNTVQRYFNNLTKNPIPANNVVNYVNQKGNLLLDKRYQASKTHDWASVGSGQVLNTTIALTEAVLGEAVVASMNIALNGLRLWAEVTAIGWVTCYLHNPTAAAVDLPSGTLTVKLI